MILGKFDKRSGQNITNSYVPPFIGMNGEIIDVDGFKLNLKCSERVDYFTL